jgi:hypothetical protein
MSQPKAVILLESSNLSGGKSHADAISNQPFSQALINWIHVQLQQLKTKDPTD